MWKTDAEVFVKDESNSWCTATAALLMMMVTKMAITWGFLRDSSHTHTPVISFLSSALPLAAQAHTRRVGSRLKLHIEIKPHSSLSFAWGAAHHYRERGVVQSRVDASREGKQKVWDEEVQNKDTDRVEKKKLEVLWEIKIEEESDGRGMEWGWMYNRWEALNELLWKTKASMTSREAFIAYRCDQTGEWK